MAKKKSALFMTVGMGGKTQERIDSLAHGMLDTILEGNFDYVVLFGSQRSKSTIESLKRQYLEKFNDDLDSDDLDEFDYYEFVQEDNVNDFNSYYNVIRSKILEFQDEYTIKINYTPGTKTMSISAAIASLIFRKKLRLIDGDRGDDTTVQSGTEKHVDFSLFKVYDEVLIRRIKEAFNNYQYSFGKSLIDELTCDEKQDYYKLYEIYSNWDNVNFDNAWKCLKDFKPSFSDLSNQIGKNKKSLGIISEPREIKKDGMVIGHQYHEFKEYYILASIINNAERKFQEKKYDDAIARLYRSFERIGQIRLEDYGIVSNDVDTEQLSKLGASNEFINSLESKANDKGIIKSGLVSNFKILSELDDDLGNFYKNNEDKYRGQLDARNQSILAHGLESKSEEEYLKFEETVREFARLLHNRMDEFIEDTKFPKFDIN